MIILISVLALMLIIKMISCCIELYREICLNMSKLKRANIDNFELNKEITQLKHVIQFLEINGNDYNF